MLGLFFTWTGTNSWDSLFHIHLGQYLLGRFFLEQPTILNEAKWYGSIWELCISFVAEKLLYVIHDASWLRHAANFTLYPITLGATYFGLRKNSFRPLEALLCVGILFSFIPLAGHSITNTKDFPLACFFLLSSIELWPLLQKKQKSLLDLILLAFWGVLPFLAHPPVGIHGVLALGILLFRREWRESFLFVFFSIILVLIFWPAATDFGIDSIWRSVEQFKTVDWNPTEPVHIFGAWYTSRTNPWWYPFIWIPIQLTPAACVTLLLGIVFKLRTISFTKNSFAHWLLLCTLSSWASVLFLKPPLYDENRHILFLYPPLFLLLSISIFYFSQRLQKILLVILLVNAALSYIQWGRYSYIYKSRFAGDRSLHQFTGDYWGLSVNVLVNRLRDHVEPDSIVVVRGPLTIALIQQARWQHSVLFRDQKEFPLTFAKFPPQQKKYYEIILERPQFGGFPLQKLQTAEYVDVVRIPPFDEVACALVRHE